MKTKALTVFLFLVVISSQLQARPSLGALEQKLDRLLYACPPSNITPRFVDNGDGTICDHRTGLMWEKKNSGDGFSDFNNPHDVDNNYTWASIGSVTAPDGSVFYDFLARLNGEAAETFLSVQLGGYSDWRLPTRTELQTIVDCSFVFPCINPVFGPTTADYLYWSSTSRAYSPDSAWLVDFASANTLVIVKVNQYHVRAVRGGKYGSKSIAPTLIITPGPGPITPLP